MQRVYLVKRTVPGHDHGYQNTPESVFYVIAQITHSSFFQFSQVLLFAHNIWCATTGMLTI